MIHTITDSYRLWLSQYIPKGKFKNRSIARFLISQMNGVESINALQILISSAFQSHPSTFSIVQDSDDPFVRRLNKLRKTIQELQKANIEKLCSQLDEISTTIETANLINLLKTVLTDPRSLLHIKAPALLQELNDIFGLKKIVKHIEGLNSKPRPINPGIGTFDAIKPLSYEHAICLDLLRNNSSTYNDADANSIGANNLLQTLLIIYQDINTKAPAPEPEAQNKSCTIL